MRSGNVLEVVEDEQRRTVPRRLDLRGDRLDGCLLRTNCAGDRRQNVVRVRKRSEVDEESAANLVCNREGKPRLSDTTCAGQRDEAVLGPTQECGDRRLLEVPADERSRRRKRWTRWNGCRKVELGILPQNRLLEVAKLWSGLDPEPVDKGGPRFPVSLESVSLAIRAVQGKHQLRAKALAERLHGDECLELGHEGGGVASEREIRGEAPLERDEAQLLEPARLALDERLVDEIRQDRSTPEVERLLKDGDGAGVIPGVEQPSSLGYEALEPSCVDIALADAQ
jgi:hypothetical protein